MHVAAGLKLSDAVYTIAVGPWDVASTSRGAVVLRRRLLHTRVPAGGQLLVTVVYDT
jgi:hypothetical protein